MPARFSESQKKPSACLPEKLPQLVLLSQKKCVPHDILTDKINVVAIKLCYVSFLCILGLLLRNLPVKRQQLFFPIIASVSESRQMLG